MLRQQGFPESNWTMELGYSAANPTPCISAIEIPHKNHFGQLTSASVPTTITVTPYGTRSPIPLNSALLAHPPWHIAWGLSDLPRLTTQPPLMDQYEDIHF